MASLGAVIQARLSQNVTRPISRFTTEGDDTVLSAGSLCAMASCAARRITELGLPARSVVGIALPSGPALHAAWLGCLWSGHIPTMVAPPSPRMEAQKYTTGLQGVVTGLGLATLLTDRDTKALFDIQLAAPPPMLLCDDLAADGPLFPAMEGDGGEVAVIQHSSGTTGQQKAIALTTNQILAHQRAYGERLGLNDQDRIVSWLPLYHDMGFVAAFLQPLITGIELIEMSPFAWAARPAMLLEAIDRHRPTLCWMPNFAFSILGEPRTLRGAGDLDLSSIRAWVNCSEPVMAQSVDRFVEAYRSHGVRPETVTASYAMAENVFAVTQSDPASQRRLCIDRERMEVSGEVVEAADGASGVFIAVSNGTPLPTTEVVVRDAGGVALGEGRIGEFHLRGTHRFEGYHGRPDLTAQAIDADGWYATGDLGFVLDGELYVTGRKKDLIILRGRNYRAQDIEAAVSALEGVKAGRVVAFSLPDPAAGTEKLVILAEAEAAAESGAVVLAIRKCVAQTFDTTVSDARIVPDRWLVKSTSGKLVRAENRVKYLRARGEN